MALLNRGRLSVQRVEDQTWSVVEKLAETGGWDDSPVKKGKKTGGSGDSRKFGMSTGEKNADGVNADDEPLDSQRTKDTVESNSARKAETAEPKKATGKKRKVASELTVESQPLRRSTRARK
jgi:hypothetical protein